MQLPPIGCQTKVKSSRPQFTRRKFLMSMGLAGLGGAAYVRVFEPEWLGVGRHTVPLAGDRDRAPLRILHLSDLHASPVVSLGFIAEAVRLGLREKPDLICLTGDFITHGHAQFEGYAEALRPLAEAAPTFACLGNHDGGAWAATRRGYSETSRVRGMLAGAGVTLLHNTAQTLPIAGRDVTLVGLGDIWAGELQPAAAFARVGSPAGTTIVLSHNPDTKDYLRPFAWDLMLCGHTHGGQVQLPFIGAPYLPIRDKRFMEGLIPWDGRWVHVTRGVGNLHGVRFNCPPEVSLLTVT